MRTASNVLANFAGRALATLVSLAAVPLYVEAMGREGFGLVGLFASLQVIQTVLDAGLGLEMSRRLARLLVDPSGHADEIGDVIRTFGTVFVGMGLVVLVVTTLVAPWVATSWVRADTLPASQVRDAMVVVGVYLALLWPSAMLNTILASAERQGIQNAINAAANVARAVATVAALWWIEPTPRVYASVQVAVTLLSMLALAVAVRRVVPRPSRRAAFRSDIVRASWVTSASTVTITLLQIGISQTDRIVLSRTLPLAELGVYSLALSLAANLHAFITPIYAAYFPRFCRTAGTDVPATRDAFIESSRAMIVVVMPPAITLAVFARETLFAWTGDPDLADITSGPLRALALGYAVAALHHVPQAMQYASGWLRPQILATGLATIGGIVWFTWATGRLPLPVLACGWLGMNSLILVTAGPVAVRKLAPGLEARIFRDMAVIVLSVIAGAVCARTLPVGESRAGAMAAVALGATGALGALSVALASFDWGRAWLRAGRDVLARRVGLGT
ncbi:MAG: oligosaccharide flippase family protein [Sandaracinaceae bacterium]